MGFNVARDPQNVFFRCVEDSDEAIMISDVDGSIVYVNPAFQKIYGFSERDVLGQTPRILHSGHHSNEFYSEMWKSIGDPEVGHWRGEVINRGKDGRLIPVHLMITPYRSPDGQISGYMGMALDLTQRKELEAQVVHQDRLASIGLLASGLAHEVGTPLGVVRGRAEFLMMQAESPVFRKNLEVIVSQTDRISKLIRSLLRISRSFGDVQIEDVDVEAVVGEVLALVGQNLKVDAAAIVLKIPPGLQVQADFSRLEQVLLNLVMNSIHAIRKAILEGRTEGHKVEISAGIRGQRVALEVKDTGCGIPPENLRKIFRAFFTTKEVGEGTGLGLAIVSQLLQEMQGEISVQSTVGQFTSFTILLKPSPRSA